MTEEIRFLRLEESVKEIKEQQTHMEARLAAMMMTRAAKGDTKRTKGHSKTKHAKFEFEMPSIEDEIEGSTTAEDWVLWPARAIGCCDH